MSIRVQVHVFARLREICGSGRLTATLTDGADPGDCLDWLLREHPEAGVMRDRLLVAVNESYAAWTDPLSDGDTVAFIPPVSGG